MKNVQHFIFQEFYVQLAKIPPNVFQLALTVQQTGLESLLLNAFFVVETNQDLRNSVKIHHS